jgi:hypothetical protein
VAPRERAHRASLLGPPLRGVGPLDVRPALRFGCSFDILGHLSTSMLITIETWVTRSTTSTMNAGSR